MCADKYQEKFTHVLDEEGTACVKCGQEPAALVRTLCVPGHAHEWDENDYCYTCGADGRA